MKRMKRGRVGGGGTQHQLHQSDTVVVQMCDVSADSGASLCEKLVRTWMTRLLQRSAVSLSLTYQSMTQAGRRSRKKPSGLKDCGPIISVDLLTQRSQQRTF